MSVDVAHYHPWHGPLRSPWCATAAIVRVALVQVFRRKAYWFLLALGLFHFLAVWFVIYIVNQAGQPPEARRALLQPLGFGGEQNGYLAFMERQSIAVTILLAFAGSLLVGADFRTGALAFYLSRRIDRRHYIVGKLLAIAAIVSLLTTLPAAAIYFEYGMFSPSLKYWIDNWRALLAVFIYGGVIATVLSIWLATLAAYLRRVAPIAITWTSLFVMPKPLRAMLAADKFDLVNLIDPWRDIHFAGRIGFGGLKNDDEREFALWALGLLAASCVVCLAALVRRVRAVEIVE